MPLITNIWDKWPEYIKDKGGKGLSDMYRKAV